MLPILATLASSGLDLLFNAVKAKGKDFVEEKFGINLEAATQTQEGVLSLKQLEFDHEEKLIAYSLEEKKLDYSLIKDDEKQITERWKSDNKSNSWIARNVRPVSFALWTVFMIMIIGFRVPVQPAWIPVVQTIYMFYLGAYIGGRTIEKLKKVAK